MTKHTIPQTLLVQFRKLLHKNPELSGEEIETAKRVRGFLKSYHPSKIIDGIGGTGVAAIYQFYSGGPTVLIRCELDALPIEEVNTFKHRSAVRDVSHKCGHDGHMAIVAGLATLLQRDRPKKGRVVLLFQPAEEDGRGAVAVLNDPKYDKIKPDYVFALHNLPGYEKHQVVCRRGIFTAAVKSMVIILKGKTSHAGEPEKGINPALAISEILIETNKLQKAAGKNDFAVVTPIQIKMGEEAYGISAGSGELRLTLRTWDTDHLNKLCKQAEQIAIKVCKKYKIECRITWTQFFSSNINDPDMVKIVKKAADKNNLTYKNRDHAFKWGEDFGLFTDQHRGAMFGIGAGKQTPALHNPDYDFPDDIIPTGVRMFKSIIDEILH